MHFFQRNTKFCLIVLSALCFFYLQAFSDPNRPNVILIIADDLGYGGLSCYGGPVKTPHIDALAQNGSLFTDAHSSASVCTPSRYSLLTGQYSWRTELKAGVVTPRKPLLIDPDTPTLADLFSEKGYQTACIGKWHLGFGLDEWVWDEAEIAPGPRDVGFDYFFGFATNVSSQPQFYIRNEEIVGAEADDPLKTNYQGAKRAQALFSPEDLTTQFLHEAKSFIEANREQPFFLYYSMHNVHHPIRPNLRFRDSTEYGLLGDFVAEMDWHVGQIVAHLEALDLMGNTLIIFSSDNGGHDGRQENKPRGNSQNPKPGGVGAVDLIKPSKAYGFSHNGALRGFKASLFEGGHRVPFITHWPAKINPGGRYDQAFSQIDLVASFANLLGADLKSGKIQDGYDMSGLLFGNEESSERASPFFIFRNNTGELAVREGNWIYISNYNIKKEHFVTSKPEYLFDLENDLAQEKDLKEVKAEKVSELKAKMLHYTKLE